MVAISLFNQNPALFCTSATATAQIVATERVTSTEFDAHARPVSLFTLSAVAHRRPVGSVGFRPIGFRGSKAEATPSTDTNPFWGHQTRRGKTATKQQRGENAHTHTHTHTHTHKQLFRSTLIYSSSFCDSFQRRCLPLVMQGVFALHNRSPVSFWHVAVSSFTCVPRYKPTQFAGRVSRTHSPIVCRCPRCTDPGWSSMVPRDYGWYASERH